MSDVQTKKADAAQTKQTRGRSPSYPAFALPEAIERLKAFHGKDGFNWAYAPIAIGHLGYKASGSTGLRALAALLHYGLLEETGSGKDRKVRVSPRGRTILIAPPEREDERRRAIVAAALAPRVYQELWAKFGPNLPTGQNIEYELARGDEFNHTIIRDLVKDFIATMEFAKPPESDTFDAGVGAGTEVDPAEGDQRGPSSPRQPGGKPMPEVQGATFDLPIPLLSGGLAVVRLPRPVSEEDYNHIKKTLEHFKTALVAPKGGDSGGKDDALS